jgi:hypothetical protein
MFAEVLAFQDRVTVWVGAGAPVPVTVSVIVVVCGLLLNVKVALSTPGTSGL